MKENPIQIIKNKLHRKPAFPDGNSLCYKGEKDGHFQALQEIPQDQEIVLFSNTDIKHE